MRQNGWAVGLILFTAVGVAAAAGGGAASFPGANGLIAFASDRDPLLNRPQIFEARVSGGRPAGLSGSEAGDYDPTPAPNGRLIAFVRVDRIRNEAAIWVMNADGSRQRRLAPGEHPVWSRDSKTIAYSFFNDELCGPGIYRCGFAIELRAVRVDESELGTIASAARHPTWSRNGLRIAYEGGIDPYGDAHEIDVANADGTNRHPIAADGAGSPAWSPTGRRIAYSLAKRILSYARMEPDDVALRTAKCRSGLTTGAGWRISTG